MCSGNKFATPIDENALIPLSKKGTYNHDIGTISFIWCAYFSLLYSLTPGVSGQVALAALMALIAMVIYHLTIHPRDLPHSSPLESSARFYTETVRTGSHPGHGTTCSGNKFATPIDEKALIPLSKKGTYNHDIGTISFIWCAYFSLLYSLTPGVSGQVALAALVALIALVIYHLTIHTRDLPHIYIYIYIYTCTYLFGYSSNKLQLTS